MQRLQHRPQPVGIWPFKEAESFETQINKMRALADQFLKEPMPATIPVAGAKTMTELALEAAGELSEKLKQQAADITNAWTIGQIGRIHNDLQSSIQRYLHPLVFNYVRPALQQNKTTVQGAPFKSNISRMMQAIVRGYESLHYLEDIKPFLLRNMPWTLKLLGKIYEVAKAIADGLTAGFDALVKGTSMFWQIMKWGTISIFAAYTISILTKDQKR